MSKAAYNKMAEGLAEALAIARGEAEPYKLHVPPEIDVRAIRDKAEMAQDRFRRHSASPCIKFASGSRGATGRSGRCGPICSLLGKIRSLCSTSCTAAIKRKSPA